LTRDLVQSCYVFHIIHVNDKHDAHLNTLDEVKDQIQSVIKQQKAARAADSLASALLTQARTAGLDKAAATRDLQVISTDFVSRTESLHGIGNSPEFMNAALEQRVNSTTILVHLSTTVVVSYVQM